jgi:hypothetical protein
VEEEDLPVVEVGVAEVDVLAGEDDDEHHDHHATGDMQTQGGKMVERLSGESELEERRSPAHELERVPTRVSTRGQGQGQGGGGGGGAPGLPSLPLTMPLSIPLEMSAVTVASL